LQLRDRKNGTDERKCSLDASKRIALSFSLSVLGLPQMMLEKMLIALQKSRELSPEISSKNG
jgi:hypothetical protein